METGNTKTKQQLIEELQTLQRQVDKQKLKLAEKSIQDIVESLQDPIYRFNLVKGNYDYISPSCIKTHGYTSEEMIAGGIELESSLIHPDDLVDLQEHVDDLLSGAELENFQQVLEYRFKHKDGDYRWISDSRSVIYNKNKIPKTIIGSFRDITDIKQSMMEREKLSHDMGERIKELQCMYDIAEVIHNEEFLETIFEKIVNIIPPAWQFPDITCARISFDKNVYTSKTFVETDWYQKANIIITDIILGTVEVFYTEKCPELDEGPFLIEERHLIDGIAQSLSESVERHLSEKSRERVEVELRHAQKMESLGTLAGGIAHDFNNILGPIMGYANLALRKLPDKSKEHQYCEEILIASKRAEDIVKQILLFTRQIETEYQIIELHHVIKQSIKLLRASIPSTVQLTSRLDENSGSIFGDISQIHQILMNLCTNAYHALPKTGGLINIVLEQEILTDELICEGVTLPSGKYICIVVQDNGHGFDDVTREHMFDQYYTTKDIGKGTGLGLSTISGIISQHKGGITAESNIGNGSTFCVYLPHISKKPVTESSKELSLATGNGIRVLIVDDEDVIAEMLEEMLETLDYKTSVETSSTKAVELFRESPNNFDLVLTDIMMPDMTGDVMVQKMRSIRSDIPVVLMTGYSEKKIDLEQKNAGEFLCLKKPITLVDLANTIQQVLCQV